MSKLTVCCVERRKVNGRLLVYCYDGAFLRVRDVKTHHHIIKAICGSVAENCCNEVPKQVPITYRFEDDVLMLEPKPRITGRSYAPVAPSP